MMDKMIDVWLWRYDSCNFKTTSTTYLIILYHIDQDQNKDQDILKSKLHGLSLNSSPFLHLVPHFDLLA